MLLIRRFEEKLLDLFSSGLVTGTTHACIGQEANSAGIFDNLQVDDIIFSNHRCHGHFLAYGGDPYLLAAEVMGKNSGLVGGRGGSQHIQWKNFYSNGIQGGIVPVAAGMAFAEKILQRNTIALAFLGDGTLGEGIVYESFNISSLWRLPILYIVENNLYAQTTSIEYALAGKIRDRFNAFDIKTWECETTDVLEIHELAKLAIKYTRTEVRPGCLIINTYRFSSHSKGDEFRDPGEIENRKIYDPLKIQEVRLDSGDIVLAENEVGQIIGDAFSRAEKDPYPNIDENLLPILL
jgi:TPP-dependent pyruvate/acetoin dehydrogenase alpha subunit